jgi:hypothetical protein
MTISASFTFSKIEGHSSSSYDLYPVSEMDWFQFAGEGYIY